MNNEFNFKSFVYEVYAKATPSVDLATAKGDILPWNHKLSTDTYEEILAKYCGDDSDKKLNCNLWMLNSGPQLTNSSRQ